MVPNPLQKKSRVASRGAENAMVLEMGLICAVKNQGCNKNGAEGRKEGRIWQGKRKRSNHSHGFQVLNKVVTQRRITSLHAAYFRVNWLLCE